MTKTQKSLMVSAWALGVLAMISLVASGMLRPTGELEHARGQERPLFNLGQVPSFSLIDQNGQPFTQETLKGQVWVCDFIFTRCAGPCPMMTQRMADLQKAVGNADVRLVSFTVDPDHDTPQVLKAYAQKYGADDKRWTLATGRQEDLHQLARDMMLAVAPAHGDTPIIHSTNFLLVDRDGTIWGPFHGDDPGDLSRLAVEATRRAGTTP